MRKVILGVGISIDGYIARKNGAVDFLFIPDDYPIGAFAESCDTAVMGRKTFDVSRKMGGSFGDSLKGYVFSRKKAAGERQGVTYTHKTPVRLLAEFRKQPGKDIWLMGGGELARDFLKADLVDELYLGIVPVLLGSGIPLFPSGFPQREFELLENKTYSKGLVSLHYERSGIKVGSEKPSAKKKPSRV
jgi:dihydrofolate reductase